MKYLLLFTSFILLFSCSFNNKSEEINEPSIDVSLDKGELIKQINNRLHKALGNETAIKLNNNHAYIFALKDDSGNLEFYYELGYDSEGWPMEGPAYYFHDKKLIGYGYVHCDGCIEQDISRRLIELGIKESKTPNEIEKEMDVIWSITEPSKELNKKAIQILNENLVQEATENESDEDSKGVSIYTLTRNVYSNNENGFETFLSFEENYSDNTGIMTLSQNRCQYVYNITIDGNAIDADFFQSTCGAESSNTTLYYNPDENSLSMFINGESFTFYSEF